MFNYNQANIAACLLAVCLGYINAYIIIGFVSTVAHLPLPDFPAGGRSPIACRVAVWPRCTNNTNRAPLRTQIRLMV